MGWNDRLPEDPFIPFENEKDRDDYEAWHTMTDEYRANETGLTSQNVTPDQLTKKQKPAPATRPLPQVDTIPHQEEVSQTPW